VEPAHRNPPALQMLLAVGHLSSSALSDQALPPRLSKEVPELGPLLI